MRILIVLFITFSGSIAYCNPHNNQEGIKHNLSASADSVEESLAINDEGKDLDLEDQQIAQIRYTLEEMNEI